MHEQSAVTSVLIAEALAHGDMGLAYAALAPGAVATAIGLWGNAEQQATYLPAFTGEDVPAAALAILEPRPLFDPLELETTRQEERRRVGPQRRQVAAGPGRGLRAVRDRRRRRGHRPGPVRGRVRRQGPLGRSRAGDGPAPRRHRPPAARGREVPASALLGEDDSRPRTTSTASTAPASPGARSRSAPRRPSLDYVIPYVNDRQAFGEPISNRQGVAFAVSDIGDRDRGHAARHLPRRQPRRPRRELRPRGGDRPPALRRSRGCRSAPRACSCSAATASSRSTRSSAGTATCEQRA